MQPVDLIQARWRKSSRSSPNGQCVEVAQLPTYTAIRDSKTPTTGHLLLTPAQFTALLTILR